MFWDRGLEEGSHLGDLRWSLSWVRPFSLHNPPDDYEHLTDKEKREAFYVKIGVKSLRGINRMIKNPLKFRTFGIVDSEHFRQPAVKYKIKKHSGREFGSIAEVSKQRIQKNEFRRQESDILREQKRRKAYEGYMDQYHVLYKSVLDTKNISQSPPKPQASSLAYLQASGSSRYVR
jgi:hypothetical protein